eukprot:CAMPEP_0201648028 /NCGR_PEP_ID=MMETSP0493-20130528/36915_1 /ASSEMBLY_ACC=CAM_ASM_000838 /TAXON_ID=420259 /ORGANISM="Thalassiosira gravida, Strain GMp14c1" /LENGTH=138 /DNA_ID=CAMNT_0048123595 /DNA_START=20 /DNA_END=433 /DNA_ORIENTATION=+
MTPDDCRNGLNASELSSDNGHQKRLSLVHFSKLHPDLVNARFHRTKNTRASVVVSMWEQNATNGMFRVLPFNEIPKEKYYTEYQAHVVMGGIGAAFRMARLMNQGIAVILQDYPYEEWFTHLLTPYVNYIPLNQNLSN